MSFLEIQNLCKSFDTTAVINDFSIEIVESTLCCLVGPNGAGKTTTMDLITGRQKPTSGQILFCDDDITGLGEHEIARRGSDASFRCPRCFAISACGRTSRSPIAGAPTPFATCSGSMRRGLPKSWKRLRRLSGLSRAARDRGRNPVAWRNPVARDRNGADAGSAAAAARRAGRRHDRSRDRKDGQDLHGISRRPTRWSWSSTTWRSCGKSPTWFR